jgi:uncharacterized protein (DUF3820 family)
MIAEIVPFGKYKGRPVEALAADEDYCEWLTAQPWFRQKYGNVYNILIQDGAEPQDSPEHNEMQARFLDDGWCLRLGVLLWPGMGIADQAIRNRTFEATGWDVVFDAVLAAETSLAGKTEMAPMIGRACIECKPDLGDDYPAVLRQVQGYRRDRSYFGRCCVVARRYAFERVTWEQVGRIFAASEIVLLAEGEIAAQADSMPFVDGVSMEGLRWRP